MTGPADAALRRRPPTPMGFYVVADVLLVAAAVGIATLLRGHEATTPIWNLLGLGDQAGLEAWDRRHTALLVLQATLAPFLLWVLDQYRVYRDPDSPWSLRRIFVACATAVGFAVAVLVLLRAADLPRTVYLLDGVLVLAGTALPRAVATRRARARHARGLDLSNVLLVGRGPELEEVAHAFADSRQGRRVVGRFRWDPAQRTLDADLRRHVEARLGSGRGPGADDAGLFGGDGDDLERTLLGLLVEEVFIGAGTPDAAVDAVISRARALGIEVHLLTHRPRGVRPTPWLLGNQVVLDIHRNPITRVGWAAKRAVDVVGAVVGLVLFLPVLLVAAVAIKLEDPHLPVLYRGRRCGRKGHPFAMLKLTTMVPEAQEMEPALQDRNERRGPWFKLPPDQDPRLTRVGRVLRRFTLNEVPQFWNVLVGDMSLVGPRPPTPDEVARYVDHDVRYYRILDVRPGMTGLWQVTAKNDPSFDRRLELDLAYMEDWSLWRDLGILARTITTAFREGEAVHVAA